MGLMRNLPLMMMMVLNGGQTYEKKLRSLFGSSVVAYWPLSEPVGTTGAGSVKDISGNGFNGAPTNITFGVPGIGDGNTQASFNGSSSRISVSSAGLTAAFSGTEGTIIVWPSMSAASVWTDGIDRAFAAFANGTYSKYFRISKASNNLITAIAGGKAVSFGTSNTITSPLYIALTWSESNDRIRVYYKGALKATNTALTAWAADTISQAWLGSTTNSAYWHSGSLANCILLNREMTPEEAYSSYAALKIPNRIGVIGDSIAASTSGWTFMLSDRYGDGANYIINHAVSGNSITADMNNQVAAAATDNDRTIVMALGTNDDNAGNMTTLQAKVEANIIALKASNPSATIYYMNILPRWTDTGGGTVIDKSNLRAAIAAACTAQSITCWDTFTTPWITAAQTSDGTHPTVAGHTAITTRMLALL